jgi:hypothetical protein
VALVLHKLILGRGLVRTIVLTPLDVPTSVAMESLVDICAAAPYIENGWL